MSAPDLRPAVTTVSEKPESLDATVQKVIHDQRRNGAIICLNQRDGRNQARGTQVNCRAGGGTDGARHALILNSGDDTIAVPAGNPSGRGAPSRELTEIQRPAGVLLAVLHDPLEELAPMNVRSLDQESDACSGASEPRALSQRSAGIP
jgi:hypothetical protein